MAIGHAALSISAAAMQIGHFSDVRRSAIESAPIGAEPGGDARALARCRGPNTLSALSTREVSALGQLGSGSEGGTVSLRLLFSLIIVMALAACSTQPAETSLASSVQVSSTSNHQENRPKTLSSDILSEIALERVTGRRPGRSNFAALPAR